MGNLAAHSQKIFITPLRFWLKVVQIFSVANATQNYLCQSAGLL